jgi:hypothetical protein
MVEFSTSIAQKIQRIQYGLRTLNEQMSQPPLFDSFNYVFRGNPEHWQVARFELHSWDHIAKSSIYKYLRWTVTGLESAH